VTALLGIFGLTGSSGAFASRVDPLLTEVESRDIREIFSTSRWIRSDEFAIEQAADRAQQLATPTFPTVNMNLGLGQLQRNPFSVPVLDWGLVFSPLSWPLLMVSRWSHGLRWFVRAALIMLGLIAWTSVLAWRREASDTERRQRENVAAAGALAIFFSSSIQWQFNHAAFDMIACAGLAAYSFHRAFSARSRTRALLWLMGGAWAATCGFFHFYAPGWAPALWLLFGAIADVALSSAGSVRRALPRALVAATLVVAGMLAALFYYAPFLEVIRSSLFPGRRIAFAGELAWARLLDLMWPSLHESAPLTSAPGYFGKHPLLNVCETSAVEAVPLYFVAALATVSSRARCALGRVIAKAPGTSIAWAVLGAWCFLPLPDWFRDLSLLRWSPGSRTFWYFGALSAALATLIVCELAHRDAGDSEEPNGLSWREGIVAVVFLGAAWVLARRELAGGNRPDWEPIALTAALLLISAFAFRRVWGPRLLMAAWLVPLMIATAPTNPLARTSDLFREGTGHRDIARTLRATPGRIVDFDTHWAATLDMFGWAVLDSVNFAPDLDLFRFLSPDSSGLNEAVYNRYGIAQFGLPGTPLMSGRDAFRAPLSPCSRRFAALGVNHFLTRSDARLPAACAMDFSAIPVGRQQLWSRRRPVGNVGVAHGEPASALDFDWSMSGLGRLVEISPRRTGLTVKLPAAEGLSFAFPINLSIVDEVSCSGASAKALDTHLVFRAGASPAQCDVRFLMTRGALRRLLDSNAPRTVFRSEPPLSSG
jgi:hypothetical protein